MTRRISFVRKPSSAPLGDTSWSPFSISDGQVGKAHKSPRVKEGHTNDRHGDSRSLRSAHFPVYLCPFNAARHCNNPLPTHCLSTNETCPKLAFLHQPNLIAILHSKAVKPFLVSANPRSLTSTTPVTLVMDMQTRNRPSLEVRTDYRDDLADELPRAAFRTHRTPLPVLSPLTAKPLPSPIQPSTPGFDVGMKHPERVVIESLDARGRQGSFSSDRQSGRSLLPIAEQAIAARVGHLTMDSPLYAKSPQLPSTAPSTPSNTQQTQQSGLQRSMADETRSMLLSGMTTSQANHLGAVANRRLSSPADVLLQQKARRQSLGLIQPDMLQAWGHVYFNEPAKADVFVAASALRRQSGGGSMADCSDGNYVVIRARIRPRNKDRKPFLIARSFDLGQLRTTLPTTPTTARRQSGVPISPDDLSTAARTPTTPLTPLTPGIGPGPRRSSLAASGLRVGGHQSKSSAKELPVRKLNPNNPLPHRMAKWWTQRLHVPVGSVWFRYRGPRDATTPLMLYPC